MPKENRKTIVRKYVAGVVVVQVVNHNVTRVLEENVDDMPDIVSMEGIALADAVVILVKDGDGIFIFMSMILEMSDGSKSVNLNKIPGGNRGTDGMSDA
jgi:phosphopantothenate synthetase